MTDTEVEALHLEQNLVKRHRPPFNVRLRDDKSFPYIAVTVEDEYPRVMFTRERHRRGVVYFGPYANAKKVRETLDVLNRVFPYRPCEGPQPGRHSGIPCLDYHIERCLAPCVGYVSNEDYRSVIDGVIEFLSGETRPILRQLEDEDEGGGRRGALRGGGALPEPALRGAAPRRAAGGRQARGRDDRRDRDRGRGRPCRGAGLPASGREADRPLQLPPRERRGTGHPDDARGVRPRVLRLGAERPAADRRPARGGGDEALAEFLTERRGSRVEVRAPERGEKRRLQELATQNARVALDSEAAAAEQTRLRRVEALEELREALNLEACRCGSSATTSRTSRSPRRSARWSSSRTRSPKKAHYRKFGIKGAEGQDDFAALAEVVSRRFARMRDVADEEYDESFSSTPNLVLVDGGKGQLSAVLAAMQAFDLPRVAVISLAKRDEEVFVPDRPEPIVLERHSPGLQLLQRIRDEAHRFALGFHRQRRDTKAKESIFDTLAGRRARAPARAAPALRLGGAIPRRVPGGARGRARGAAEDGALDLRAAAQGRPRLTGVRPREIVHKLTRFGPLTRRSVSDRGSSVRRRHTFERVLTTGRAQRGWGRASSGPVLAPAQGPQRDEDRGEAERHVDGDQRDPHADAEGDERRPRDLPPNR